MTHEEDAELFSASLALGLLGWGIAVKGKAVLPAWAPVAENCPLAEALFLPSAKVS